MKTSLRFRFVLSILLAIFVCSVSTAQKAKFENLTVLKFDAPHDEITVEYFGEPLKVLLSKKTSIKGKGRKNIDPQLLEEGTIITSLGYELKGSDYLATLILTNISADGSIEIGGLFEGYFEGKPLIDGYPVLITPGVTIEGSNRKTCECKGLMVPSFNSPLIKPGKFYVTVRGNLGEDGVVKAKSIELCRNTFDTKDQAYMAALSTTLVANTSELGAPSEYSESTMTLFKGEVKVGELTHKLSDDIRLQGYVGYVASKVIPESAEGDRLALGTVDFRTYVVDNPVPNAIAFPNGMIFVNTGLLDLVDNEAQLAAILGHEVAHITHKHGKEKFENKNTVEGVTNMGKTFIDRKFNSDFSKALADLPEPMKVAVEKILSAVSPTMISNIMYPQSKMEEQADRLGLYYAYSAGYDIREAAKFWAKVADVTADPTFRSRVSEGFLTNLNTALGDKNRTLVSSMSLSATQVLTDEALDNIYTSHPKARKRATDMSKMLSKVYQNAEWNTLTIGQESFARAMR